MSSVNIISGTSGSDECGIHDLAAELRLEICSYLEIHDQLAMRRVCKRWRSKLSAAFLSRYINLDVSKIPNQPEKPEHVYSNDSSRYSGADVFVPELWIDAETKYNAYLTVSENRLEYALNQHLQKNTNILVIRHGAFERNQFDIVKKVIQEKEADLFQLVLKDCQVQEMFSAYWGVLSQSSTYCGMHGLISAARRLILANYAMPSVLLGGLIETEMPCNIDQHERDKAENVGRKLPIVLPRHEFDRSQLLLEHYHSFIMALNSNCPEVNPDVRDAVVALYNSWKHCNASAYQWQSLGFVVNSLNEGVLENGEEVDVSALRELDPLTLNKLTVEELHRMYCLPGQRYDASIPAIAVHVAIVG